MKRRWLYRRRKPMWQKRKPLSFRQILFVSFVVFLVLNFFSLWIVDKSIEPILKSIASVEVKRIATEAVNDAVYESVAEEVNIQKLIVQHKGEPTTYSFDSKEYLRILSMATKSIEERLGIKHDGEAGGNINDLSKGQMETIEYQVPLGVATRTTLLANMGPEIPVEIAIVRDVKPKLQTKMTEAGINNTYIELYLQFTLEMQIVIPFRTDEEPLEFEVKIGDFFYPGEVPKFYGGQSIPVPAVVEEEKEKKE
ncbi:MAG: sporulation protein YunB [Bacillus sp. (in: firmicutes)]